MNNSVQFTLSIPAKLYNHLIALFPGENGNRFVLNAIKEKLNQEEAKLKQQMIEGYKATKFEDYEITKDFADSDFEKID